MERVVITGIGVVNAIGNTKEEYWDALAFGKNGIGPLTYFDASEHRTQIAGEVKNFQAEQYMDSPSCVQATAVHSVRTCRFNYGARRFRFGTRYS